MIVVPINRQFDDWRIKARELLATNIHPDQIHWKTEECQFIFGEIFGNRNTTSDIKISRDFIEMAYIASCFRDDDIWSLLYRIAWRIIYEDKNLLKVEVDIDVANLNSKIRLVNRDVHKMKAFVRFKELKSNIEETIYVAWHRPDHRITRLAAPFFKDRFNGMKWVIMTEDETIYWDKKNIEFHPGVKNIELPQDDKEDLWKTYYSSIFNPARIKVSMMKKELPVRHWKTLPEAELITSLLDDAPSRLKTFYDGQNSPAQEKEFDNLKELNEAVKKCQACGICDNSNKRVFGDGPQSAQIMFVADKPEFENNILNSFFSRSGKFFNQSLFEIGIDPKKIYLSYAIKGFREIENSTLRQKQSLSSSEIAACRPWIQNEIKLVKPQILVCFGRSAAQSVLGKMVKLEDIRGQWIETALCKQTIILPDPRTALIDEDLASDFFLRFKKELDMIKKKLETIIC